MSIPKITHFIAPEDRTQWHPIWHRCYQSWIDQHPDFEIKLWNDKNDLYDLIQTCYPWCFLAFESFPYDIMRINFARFALLHQFGGTYADMDIFCYKNFYSELQNNDAYMIQNLLSNGSESVSMQFPFEICMMSSVKNHGYFNDCMQNSVEQFNRIGHLFDKPTVDDEWLIISLTDSIAIQSRDIHNTNQISLLSYDKYNNRAPSYDRSFFTKHMRSSAWNRDFTPNKYLVVESLLFTFSDNDKSIQAIIDKAKDLGLSYHIVDIDDFDFYYDYSEGNYFRGDSSDKDLKQRIKQLYQYLVN